MEAAKLRLKHESERDRFTDMGRMVMVPTWDKRTPRGRDKNDSGSIWQVVHRTVQPPDLDRAGPWRPPPDSPPSGGRSTRVDCGITTASASPSVSAAAWTQSGAEREPLKVLPESDREAILQRGGVRRLVPPEKGAWPQPRAPSTVARDVGRPRPGSTTPLSARGVQRRARLAVESPARDGGHSARPCWYRELRAA
mmetsp:Transcript_52161/g.144417  ORF Transcript_52161/g.144417 Transcript_52161/m.144417 type:complete len:196 (-) Transcript_52161:53-640(-)